MRILRLTCVFILFLAPTVSKADVKLANVFSDHMVLQRNRPVPVWGSADPGEKVTVSFNKQVKSVTAGANGKWMIKLDKLSAGGPFTLGVKGKNSFLLKDVYVGEVRICSGQSNMDMTVATEDRGWAGVFKSARSC